MAIRNPKVKPSELENAYSSLWMRFKDACGPSLAPHLPSGKGIRMLHKSDGIAEISSFFYLSSWPYRSSRSSEKVDILVRSTEHVDCKQNSVVKSTVQVVYFESPTSDPAQPLLGLHYDFETDVSGAHPVFHVQLGNTDFDARECQTVGFRKTISMGKQKMYGRVRIPTPHIRLCSILLCLAADHLPEKQYKQFLSYLRTSELLKLDVACDHMRDSVANSCQYWSSHHWYS